MEKNSEKSGFVRVVWLLVSICKLSVIYGFDCLNSLYKIFFIKFIQQYDIDVLF